MPDSHDKCRDWSFDMSSATHNEHSPTSDGVKKRKSGKYRNFLPSGNNGPY